MATHWMRGTWYATLLIAASWGEPSYAAPFAYIAEPYRDRVLVIDAGATPPAIVATIPVGRQPQGVAVHPGRVRAYVSNTADGTVSVINTNTNTVVATVTGVGGMPHGVAVNPAGSRVYVAIWEPQGIAVIDTATNAVSAQIITENAPFFVAVHPDGSRLYVALWANNSVGVIDTVTNQILPSSIPVGATPFAVAINPAGTLGYTANFGVDTVSVFDTGTNLPVATVPIGGSTETEAGMSVAVAPDGSRVYVGNDWSDTDKVWVIDATTNTVAGSIDLDDNGSIEANSVAVDPSGTRLYVTTGTPGIVGDGQHPAVFWVVDTATNQVIGSVPGLDDYARGLGHFITGCATDAVCNDGFVCTEDRCVNFSCVHTCVAGPPCGAGCAGMVCKPDGAACTCALP